MPNALMKCPHCGQLYKQTKELDDFGNTYTCSSCHKSFSIEFFDYCPVCKHNVGFIESRGFSNDMKHLGVNAVKTGVTSVFGNPFKALGGLLESAIDAFTAENDGCNGDGECPYCHNRFIRCPKCDEMYKIDHNANWTANYNCPKCGTQTSPSHYYEDRGGRHSQDFYRN